MSSRNPDSAFSIAREAAESRIVTNPLRDGDPTHRVLTSRWFCDVNHWGPGRLNDPDTVMLRGHPSYPDLYCVRPDELERQVDRLVWFTRTYASIPRAWNQISSGIITLPGFNHSPTYAAAQTITAVATREFGSIFRLTKSSHGYSAGDNVHVHLSLSVPGGGRGQNLAGGKPPPNVVQSWMQSVTIRAATTDTFDVPLAPYNLALPAFYATIIVGSVRKITAGFEKRPAETRNVTTNIRRDYFLPGVSEGVPNASLIPLAQPFRIQQGTETDEIFEDNVLTGNTVPTATQYRASIDANGSVPVDCVLEEYLGPIVCRKTTSHLAQ